MARLSGLQREVLSLYRQCFREIRNKPADSRNNFKQYTRIPDPHLSREAEGSITVYPGTYLTRSSAEFQKHRSVNKKDFGAVEYLLRKGHRQLEMYSSLGIRNIR
ncbi:complex 1 protein-domain-containing protein [Penicillium hetheringtonii]|uniref:Complex 1 protein-domain-containing protein n=1 Tax=Penicillium hetheringtonii TaxID=911720 RepID=A0AAD6GQ11_9EURO|nr:complex 1 protein-domain-containing protein [Penicillium hetheringtonii]